MAYSIETYQREDKWWSFRINGEESHYRSSNEDGLQRTINLLLQGPSLNKVRLKSLAVQTKVNSVGGEAKEEPHWSFAPSISERVKAFLSRGKLSAKENEEAKTDEQEEELA